MAQLEFFALTAAQAASAQALDDDSNAAISPRAVDNESPGVGLNLSDSAAGYERGDPVPLTGMLVAARRIADDPAYRQHCPGLVAFLLTLPWASLETGTIFAPPEA